MALRAPARPEAIAIEVHDARFVERTLRIALQAALDAAAYIAPDERLGGPRTHCELFDRLEEAGWLEPSFAGAPRDLAGVPGFGWTAGRRSRRECTSSGAIRPELVAD